MEKNKNFKKRFYALGDEHNVCLHEWVISPSTLLNGKRRCSKCFGTLSKSQEGKWFSFVDLVIHGEYKWFGPYSNTYIEIYHSTPKST